MHHPRADIERLNINRENEGRGLIHIELTNKTIIIGLKKYLDTTPDTGMMVRETWVQFHIESYQRLKNGT